MQAIRTRIYLDANGNRKVAAACRGGRVILERDPFLDDDGNHKTAMQALCTRMKWTGHYVSGVFNDDTYWVEDQGMRVQLKRLLKWATSGNRVGNPFCKKPVKSALQALADADKIENFFFANDDQTDDGHEAYP